MASQTLATPGVYASERSSRLVSGTVAATAILPPRCRSKTGSGRVDSTVTGDSSQAEVRDRCRPVCEVRVGRAALRGSPDDGPRPTVSRDLPQGNPGARAVASI